MCRPSRRRVSRASRPLPGDIVSKVNKLVNEFLTSEKGKTVLEQNALQGVGGPPDDLKAFIAGELSKWRPVIESAKISM